MDFNKYFSIVKREISEAIVNNKGLILLMTLVFVISAIAVGFFKIICQVFLIFSYKHNVIKLTFF